MFVKSSKSLVFTLENSSVSGYNFLKGETFETEETIFPFMENHSNWAELSSVIQDDYSDVIKSGVLIEKDSELYSKEKDFEEQWHIGMPAAIFHFSLLDREYKDLEYNKIIQQKKYKKSPSPQLYQKNTNKKLKKNLKTPLKDNLYEIMSTRRSNRETRNGHTSLQTLSDMLYCSLGITNFTEGDAGELPLKMTPSAGARNPYEAYVFVRNVDGLKQGIYHYSAVDHDIEEVAELPEKALGSYIGNQDWADEKNALIILVAYMERSMWKYEDPNIYRAIMIEAGHIAQNMMLVATRDQQTLCPTAALCHSEIMGAAKIEQKITRSPIYALALGPNS